MPRPCLLDSWLVWQLAWFMQSVYSGSRRCLHLSGPNFYPESNHFMSQNLHSLRPGARAFGIAAALALAGISTAAQAAPPVRTLHSFNGNDGKQPANGLVVAPDGTLYGDTDAALGNSNRTISDVIFKTRPDGSGIQLLHTFPGTNVSGANSDGSAPNRLLLVDGFLYGTTYTGGANGTGVIFKMDTNGGSFQILHTFGPNNSQSTDGAGPASGLTLGPDGFLYGVTYAGGAGGGGSVYRIYLADNGYQVIYRFSSAAGSDAPGYQPNTAVVFGSDGSLYGTTQAGGGSGKGTVYKIVPDTLAFSVLHSFDTAGGYGPQGVIYGSDGNLYGTTFIGGPGDSSGFNGGGTLFKLTLSKVYTVIHSFVSGTDQPAIPLTPPTEAPDGTLYGATNGGGTAGVGAIYQYNKNGGIFQIVGSLTKTTGDSPSGPLVIANQKVYGTAQAEGAFMDGTLFSLALPSVSHILWRNNDGTQALWTVQPDYTVTTKNYGPYAGWTAKAVADTPDGHTHLIWNHSPDGLVAVWDVAKDGNFTAQNYGPFSGWSAQALSAGPDGRLHILWNHSPDSQMSLWAITADANVTYKNYGPFTGWTAKGVATGGDGNTDVLWTNTDGTMSTWKVSEADGSFQYHNFGPYAGWTANAVAAGPDGQGSIAWGNRNGTQSLWSIDFGSGEFSTKDYGPIGTWGVTSVAVGADGLRHLLWNHGGDSQGALWTLDSAGGFTHSDYGPYSGWSVTALSAGQ